jgi:hypothetical protein
MEEMGIPISDIAKRLDATSEAIRMRFKRRGIKPFRYIGTTGLYHESDIEAIKDAFMGNHKAKQEPPPKTRQSATKPKAKKPKKS